MRTNHKLVKKGTTQQTNACVRICKYCIEHRKSRSEKRSGINNYKERQTTYGGMIT